MKKPRDTERAEDRCSSQVADSVRGMENYWSLLKRGLAGTYVSVEPYQLFRYLDEQAYRFNNRKEMNDFDRFKLAASQIVGKRMTWKQVIGMDFTTSTN